MQVGIKTKSPNTEEYFKYILSEIAKHRPFQVGERIVLQVEEGRTPMPEFKEIPTPPGRIFGEMKDKSGKVIGIGYAGFDPRRTIAIQIADEKHIFDSRIGAIWDYTCNKLTGLCRLYSGDFNDDPPIKGTFRMTVISPEEIDKEIKKLNISDSQNELALKNSNTDSFPPVVSSPTLSQVKDRGFLVVSNHNPNQIFIGKITSRTYKLLEALFNPKIGTTKVVSAVFEAIKINRDENNPRLKSSSTSDTAKAEIIDDTITKIYSKLKAHGLQGALRISSTNKRYTARWSH